MAGAEQAEISPEEMEEIPGIRNSEKMEEIPGSRFFEEIRAKIIKQQAIFSKQVCELHRVLGVQRKLAELAVPRHRTYRQPDMVQQAPAATFRQIQIPMDGQQIQMPPGAILVYTPNLYFPNSGDYLSISSSGVPMRPPMGFEFPRIPANKDSEHSHSPRSSEVHNQRMNMQQLYANSMNKTNLPLPLPAQSTFGYNIDVQNPKDFLGTSSSGVTMRPPMSLAFPRPANKDSEPSPSRSRSDVYKHYMEMQQLYAYHMNKKNLPLPAQSTPGYNFAVQNPSDYPSNSSSGVTMRPSMGIEFQRPANKDSRRPSEFRSSSQVSSHRMNMQKLYAYGTDKMIESMNAINEPVMMPPMGLVNEPVMMPPMGLVIGKPDYAENQAGSSSRVNQNSYKISTDESDKDGGIDLSLSIAVGDSRGKSKLESLSPVPSQGSSFSDPAHDSTKRRDLTDATGSSSGAASQT